MARSSDHRTQTLVPTPHRAELTTPTIPTRAATPSTRVRLGDVPSGSPSTTASTRDTARMRNPGGVGVQR
jgi:hypothetical protein